MIKADWSMYHRQYLAADPENMPHINRFGISEANAIARVKAAHAHVKTKRTTFKKKIADRRIAIASASKGPERSLFAEIAERIRVIEK